MRGTVTTGQGRGGRFVEATAEVLAAEIGFRPYPGTLNLTGLNGLESLPRALLEEDLGDPRCEGVHIRPCAIGGIRSSVIRPLVPDYPSEKVELLAPIRIRDLFSLEEGSEVPVSQPDDLWTPSGPQASPDSLNNFDALVFDLDGTLVELAVDWSAVHDEIDDRFGSRLDKPVTDHDVNALFGIARREGFYDDLVALIESHEFDGASGATPLAPITDLGRFDVPVGICTANAGRAARRALSEFDAVDAVDAVVARETTRPGKPDPGPLLECLDRLGREPGNAIFIGDQPVDAKAAAGAETSFLHVNQLWPP